MDWPEITKDTSLEEIKRIHQMIWQYAMDHGVKPVVPYSCACALCEYVRIHRLSCTQCPVIWSNSLICNNHSHDDEYSEWIINPSKITAERVRDIPFKYELEEVQNGGSKD